MMFKMAFKKNKIRDISALLFATVTTIATVLAAAPTDIQNAVPQIYFLASVGWGLTTLTFWYTLIANQVALERVVTAIFLPSMPFVYVIGWLQSANSHKGWLWIEMASVPLYGIFTYLGVKRSPWFLVAGILGHGLWDLWHFLIDSAHIPLWYSLACFVADVGVAAYIASRVPLWREALK